METLALYASGLLAPLQTGRGVGIIGLTALAGCLIVASSFVRTMVPLRTLAVLSNLAFLIAAFLAQNPASVLLYCILIPVNTYRLREIMRLTERVNAAADDKDLSGVWLKPYMKPRRFAAGATVFHQGDQADTLYLLVEGKVELIEIGTVLPEGQLFGEISYFSPSRTRTLTARCQTDCLVLTIQEGVFRQLYFQNPKFAFTIGHLITQRLTADIQRLQQRIASLEKNEPSMRQATPGEAPVPAIHSTG